MIPPSLIQLANTSINNTAAFPITGTALTPDLIGISLSTTLSFNSGVTQADQAIALSTAAGAASNYISNLSIGAPLIINQIADSRISDVGQPNDSLTKFRYCSISGAFFRYRLGAGAYPFDIPHHARGFLPFGFNHIEKLWAGSRRKQYTMPLVHHRGVPPLTCSVCGSIWFREATFLEESPGRLHAPLAVCLLSPTFRDSSACEFATLNWPTSIL